MARISPLAHVDLRADLAEDVEVGPFCLVGPHVRLGSGCKLDSHVVITGHTTVGRNNRFFPNAVIGCEPQDYSYSGAPTRVEIGDDNIFREGVTVHRAAEKEDQVTRIGNHNFLMANCHVAHNCWIQDHTVIVNGVLLGGHVHVEDHAIVSGNTVVHHFSTIGTSAFVSGGSRVTADLPPYMLAVGTDMRVVTINTVGCKRRGIDDATIRLLKRAHRKMYKEMKTLQVIIDEFSEDLGNIAFWPKELRTLIEFVERQSSGKSGRGGEARRDLPPPSQERKAA